MDDNANIFSHCDWKSIDIEDVHFGKKIEASQKAHSNQYALGLPFQRALGLSFQSLHQG